MNAIIEFEFVIVNLWNFLRPLLICVSFGSMFILTGELSKLLKVWLMLSLEGVNFLGKRRYIFLYACVFV